MRKPADIIPSKLSHILVRRELRHVPLASDHGGTRVGAACQRSSLHVPVSVFILRAGFVLIMVITGSTSRPKLLR